MLVTPDIFQDFLRDAPQKSHVLEETALLRIVCKEDRGSYI